MGPLPSQLLWKVDTPQPSICARQHLTNLMAGAFWSTGNKNVFSCSRYLPWTLLRIALGKIRCTMGKKVISVIAVITVRAVFKWVSKVITWLRLLRLVIGLKDSRQFFNQWESKPKPIAPCTRDFSRAFSKFQIIARNYDWFIALFAPVVIGRSNCFGFGFATVIWKPLYQWF